MTTIEMFEECKLNKNNGHYLGFSMWAEKAQHEYINEPFKMPDGKDMFFSSGYYRGLLSEYFKTEYDEQMAKYMKILLPIYFKEQERISKEKEGIKKLAELEPIPQTSNVKTFNNMLGMGFDCFDIGSEQNVVVRQSAKLTSKYNRQEKYESYVENNYKAPSMRSNFKKGKRK